MTIRKSFQTHVSKPLPQLAFLMLFVWLSCFALTGESSAQIQASTVSSASETVVPINSREQNIADIQKQANLVEQQFGLIKKIIQTTKPVVVHIEAKKRQESKLRNDTERKGSYVEEAGSGVVIEHNSRFYIITNFHVIENSSNEDIRIEADGKWFYPTRIIHDKQTDISVMFCDRDDLIAAQFGDSNSTDIGDFVVAVGSPFGLSHSVSYGIISAKGRRDLELGPQGVRFQDFIQTDAAINPGNSGGPLINLRGEVIGINTAIASNSGGSDGIGFSIPSNMALKIATDLIDHGQAQRGFLGVSLDARFSPGRAISLGMRRPHGARVSAITPGSPAAQSSIRIGDIVLEFDGISIANDSHLVTQVSLTEIGQEVPVKIFRAGKIEDISVTVGSREKFPESE